VCRVRGDRFERLIDRDRLIAADYRFMDIAAARRGPTLLKLGSGPVHKPEDEAVEQFVDVAGRKIWTRLVGHGPAVVLCSGAGAASVGNWPEIEHEAAHFATVVTYDRAGTGRSDAPDVAPTAYDMAEELTAVLNSLAINGPVILVGFSFAAFPVQLFACRSPAEVAGLILLDPLPDEFLAQLVDQPPVVRASLRAKTTEAPYASPALTLETEKSVESAVQVRAALASSGPLDVPLVVLAIEHPEPSGLGRSHAAIARRSAKGRLILVRGTSHLTFRGDKAQLIVNLIREMCANP
jgi:pimeloyl-ACP methyl ester carboxylesterase